MIKRCILKLWVIFLMVSLFFLPGAWSKEHGEHHEKREQEAVPKKREHHGDREKREEHAEREDREHHEHRDHNGHRYYRYHDHPKFGLRLSFIPDMFFHLWIDGVEFTYYDGLYYRCEGPDYVIVEPPIGALVPAIPADYIPVVIRGVTYYTCDGIYYVRTREGYRVVPPVRVVVPPPVDREDTFSVNVPNDSGGSTNVIIRRSGDGYVGPQGEYYPEFPTISQLRVLYGR